MLIAEGLWLMFLGMFVVFSFLILLVMVMILSTKFFEVFADYFPDPPAQEIKPKSNENHVEIAAVLAAVHHYQNS